MFTLWNGDSKNESGGTGDALLPEMSKGARILDGEDEIANA